MKPSQAAAVRKREISRQAGILHRQMMSYDAVCHRALDAWADENYTAAARYFRQLAKLEKNADVAADDIQAAEGMDILATYTGNVSLPCARCGHERYWHILQLACVQCLIYETQESLCQIFIK